VIIIAFAIFKLSGISQSILTDNFLASNNCKYLFLWNSCNVPIILDMICGMSPPSDEVDQLMSELRQWCEQKHGRQKEIADALNVSEQVVSNWLYRRKTPLLKNWLGLQAFQRNIRKGEK
jgi:hypothetical protein